MANPTDPPVGDPSSKWLAATGTKTATGNSTIVALTASYSMFLAYLSCSAAGGTSPTLIVRIQTLLPDNTTWQDIAAFTTLTGTANRVMGWVSGGSSEFAQSAGSLANGTFKTIPMGSKLREQHTLAGTSPSFTYTLDVEFFV